MPSLTTQPAANPLRRWRFSLRTLLLVVVAVAIAAAFVGRFVRQRIVVANLRQMGVDVDYDSGIQTAGEGEGGQVQSFTQFQADWVLENDLIYDVHSVRISANHPNNTPRWWTAEESRRALTLAADLPDLQSLMLNRCVVRRVDLARLSCLSQLTELIMYDVDAHDEDLEPLRNAHNLIEIQMFRVPIGDNGFACFQDMQNIELLDLDEVRLTDKGLGTLAKLPRLRELSLSSDLVTDQGMVALGQCHTLRVLRLSAPGISDRGASEIARLVNLEELSLWGTHLTDAGADVLAALPNLKKAYLDGRKPRNSIGQSADVDTEP